MWLVLLLACAEEPLRQPGRNTSGAGAGPELVIPERGVTVRIVAGSPQPGTRVDVLVRDPDWRPLAQHAEVLAVDPPRVTLRLPDDEAVELAGVVALGWDVSVRTDPSWPHAVADQAESGSSGR
jgi:hypothetical protein